ncbi:MAG: histidine kinase [Tissierellia bacterium]|nr:histidine kinase [Tissierellia bacterium]
MHVQRTNWGHIQWIHLEDAEHEVMGMNVGIVTLDINAHQVEHAHFDAQVIYFTDGIGDCYIDGEKFPVSPGSIFAIPVGVKHEIFNTGKNELKHLLVSNPFQGGRNQESSTMPDSVMVPPPNSAAKKKTLHIAIEAIRTQFLATLAYSYRIYDHENILSHQSDYVPDYCMKYCAERIRLGTCPCLLQLNTMDFQESYISKCPYNLIVINVPIYFQNMYLGFIQGGYLETDQKESEYYEYPESSIQGIQSLLEKVSKAIRNYCEFMEFNHALEKRDSQIKKANKHKSVLLNQLKQVNYEMIDLKINNHFLFNILNSMAAMSLEADQWDLYHSIISLSKMLSYSMKKDYQIVQLKDEIEYVKLYLKLQEYRFGIKLKVQYSIDEQLLGQKVPFNFIQPIVENAFVHGMEENGMLEIRIEVKKNLNTQNSICITIDNSGKVLLQEQYDQINHRMASGTSHGLSMVYQKLMNVYGEFHFVLEPICGYGTKGVLVIPYLMDGEEKDDTSHNL